MKYIVMLVTLIAVAGCMMPGYIPTPDMAMGIGFGEDGRNWEPQFGNSNPSGFLMEFVPAGDSIDSWKEMFAQQIVFTSQGLDEYVANWELGLANFDSDIEMDETTNSDGSITATYESVKANEFSIRRFIKASDGIYMYAYFARPDSKDSQTIQKWKNIIAEAELTPNPQK